MYSLYPLRSLLLMSEVCYNEKLTYYVEDMGPRVTLKKAVTPP